MCKTARLPEGKKGRAVSLDSFPFTAVKHKGRTCQLPFKGRIDLLLIGGLLITKQEKLEGTYSKSLRNHHSLVFNSANSVSMCL